jgi:plasmid stabilization system protein ParE
VSLPVFYLPEAEGDIDQAYYWYETQRAGLGEEFLEEVRLLVDHLRDNPQLYGVLFRKIRAVPLRRFPYVIYYRDRDADILIIAVQHARRSYRAWRGRV